MKAEKADEIVYMLEMFQGELSLTDILNYEIPFLESLKLSKQRLREKIKKGG